jgi:hypothetical protein
MACIDQLYYSEGERQLTLFFFGLSSLGAFGRAADLNDNFLSISDLDGGAAAGGGTPPVGLCTAISSVISR